MHHRGHRVRNRTPRPLHYPHPHRHTPLHSRHKAAGAVFMPAGDWQRPAYYAADGQEALAGLSQADGGRPAPVGLD